jgi:hypothetical protein
MASGGKGDPFRERLTLALIAVAVINRPPAAPEATAFKLQATLNP